MVERVHDEYGRLSQYFKKMYFDKKEQIFQKGKLWYRDKVAEIYKRNPDAALKIAPKSKN